MLKYWKPSFFLLRKNGHRVDHVEHRTTTDYDAPNRGTITVGFDYKLKSGESVTLQVLLVPEGSDAAADPLEGTLADWWK